MRVWVHLEWLGAHGGLGRIGRFPCVVFRLECLSNCRTTPIFIFAYCDVREDNPDLRCEHKKAWNTPCSQLGSVDRIPIVVKSA